MHKAFIATWIATSIAFVSSVASAQTPPPNYYPPPPNYYPPPNYGPPPPYYQQPPASLPYNEGDPVPPGYRVVEKPRTALFATGMGMFSAAYVTSIFVGSIGAGTSTEHKTAYEWLELPVLGPFVAIGEFDSHEATMPLLLDGAIQTAGAAMAIIGLTVKKQQLLRNDIAFSVMPIATPKTEGLSIVGLF